MKQLGKFTAFLAIVVAALLFDTRILSFIQATYSPPKSHVPADVTAVVLNWVRVANVVQIVALLCGSSLDGVIKEIVVWNNNPLPLVDNDFTCNKLRIHNSTANLYFQARFIACANASTPYCFIQDDDYLVKPEVIRSLRSRIDNQDIFHLPPDEVLSSRLLSINSSFVHFAFSWLGYGALIHRHNAASFLSLLGRLGVSQEEIKMADNYYSILSNSFPEIWIGAPIALFGGGDFTVGEEGVARNRKHIAAAAKYLDAIVTDTNSSSNPEWPYVSLKTSPPKPGLERSPCLGRLCIFESNILSLPDSFVTDTYKTAGEIFSRETELSTALTEEFTSTYIKFPLSHAVDSDPDTSFKSTRNAAQGDALVLDVFDAAQQMTQKGVEWSWLVDAGTAQMLRTSTYSYSSDRSSWAESSGAVFCTTSAYTALQECRVPVEGASLASARYFRLQLRSTLDLPWRIYETWLDTGTRASLIL
ncbi:hypothetical protein DFH07DRAFT_836493 [Mycena maculata]|uniref:Uncharacterized protein n=1 Tax=Mycena maculata TaxID=230809 RepID=A0AAD7IGA4_9AGAR|nr:hypothetical protein DFH07DRAFT_836493 [Mycena maculata]